MKNLFIDSNIWLSLYHFSKNDLEQFSKLKNHLGVNIQLFLPEQVREEVLRNRDAKIKEAFSSLKEWKPIQFPNLCKGYEEYEGIYNAFEELGQRHQQWIKKISEDIRNQTLPADLVIGSLFNSLTTISTTEHIICAAERRYKIGRPPGKNNKLGDAINWECLLLAVPNGEDLYIVSADGDYQSVLDKATFNLFLKNEWKSRKHSEVHYYSDLVLFLNEHAKDIQLQDIRAQEEEHTKEELICSLQKSHSYAQTHTVIGQLWGYFGWNSTQIERMCEAAICNSQILDIFSDPDIRGFYRRLLSSTDATTEYIQKVRVNLL